MAISTVPRYLAGLTVAGIVSGQYTGSSSTDTTITTTTTTTAVATSTAAPYSTETGPIYNSSPIGSSVTDTNSPTSTTAIFYYCTSSPTFSATAPFVTIYNTVYIDVCLTGTTEITYTITDTCGCQHSADYTRPTSCPSSFTTTEKICTACPGSPIITCTTHIAPATQTGNPANPTGPLSVAPISGGSQTSSPQSNSNQQLNGSLASNPGTKPTYQTTNNGKPAAGSSPLALIMVMSMAVVAGLKCVL